MSEKALRKAAKIRLSEQIDFESKLILMLMADRADDEGILHAHEDELAEELAKEINAIKARRRGDNYGRHGVDYSRVNRVIKALEDADPA